MLTPIHIHHWIGEQMQFMTIIPVPNKDIFVQAWYQGGISIMDFTDSLNPIEIAYFDRGPILEDILITGLKRKTNKYKI